MKNVFTILGLLIATLSFGQFGNSKDNLTVKEYSNLKISIEVDSAEDIESSFNVKDFKEVLDNVNDDEPIEFEMKCNKEKMSNGVKSSISYKVKGNSKDKKVFLKRIKKVRVSAINFYNK
jgi:hypothetical protein